jgi:antitoxin Phd
MSAASALTYRNSRGELIDVPSVAATQLKNALGVVLEQAMRGGAVAITRHDTPKAVLLSYDEFKALTADRAPNLHELRAEYDVLLERMQTPKARKGMAAAFDAIPAQLGKAAVKRARAGK